MSTSEKMNDKDSWQAAEYALGVLDRDGMLDAEKRVDIDPAFREAVDGWHSQLEPLLDNVHEAEPPAQVWKNIEGLIAGDESVPAVPAPQGIWKLLAGITTAVAAACVTLFVYFAGNDITPKRIMVLENELAAARTETNETLKELESASGQIAQLNEQLTSTRNELLDLNEQVANSMPLVASLTQSGDAPAFVAQFDPLKGALLIRTAVEDADEKVPEVWLIPSGGPREGDVISLGVMDETAPDTLVLSEENLPLVTEGGTLAITMEPVGGAPNGVATGPVIALGQLQAF